MQHEGNNKYYLFQHKKCQVCDGTGADTSPIWKMFFEQTGLDKDEDDIDERLLEDWAQLRGYNSAAGMGNRIVPCSFCKGERVIVYHENIVTALINLRLLSYNDHKPIARVPKEINEQIAGLELRIQKLEAALEEAGVGHDA